MVKSLRGSKLLVPCWKLNRSGNENATAIAVAFSSFDYCGTAMLLMVFSTWADQVSGSGV